MVSTIGQALEQIARGDLTARCADLGQKYAPLCATISTMRSAIPEAAMSKVSVKGGDIAVSKEEIRRASNEPSQRILSARPRAPEENLGRASTSLASRCARPPKVPTRQASASTGQHRGEP